MFAMFAMFAKSLALLSVAWGQETCFLQTPPPLGHAALFRQSAFLMTHDSATGFIGLDDVRAPWAQAQMVNPKTQLQCGARALDIRLVLWDDGKIYFHHGTGTFSWTSQQTLPGELPSLKDFAAERGDLVTLIISHCNRVQDKKWNSAHCNEADFLEPFKALGVRFETDCSVLNTIRTAEIHETLWAIDGKCVDDNWDSSVTKTDLVKPYIQRIMSKHFTEPFQVQAFLQQGWSWENPFDEIQGRKLNSQIFDWLNNTKLFQNVNFLEVNFICHRGPLMARKLGATILPEDLESCMETCQRYSKVPLQWLPDKSLALSS